MTYQQPPVFDPAHELQHSAELLVKRPWIGLPMAIVSSATIVVFALLILGGFVAAFSNGAQIGSAVVTYLPLAAVGFVVFIAVYAFGTLLTICAATDMLADRPIDWGRAFARAAERFWPFVLLTAMCTAATLIVLPFCLLLVGIPGFLGLWYFLTYAAAAVAIDGESATQAIATSIRIARTRTPETIVAWLGLVAAFVLASIVNGFLGHVPFVNIGAAFLIGGFTAAFSEIVRVRFYLALRTPGVPSTLTSNVPAPPPYIPPYVPPSGI